MSDYTALLESVSDPISGGIFTYLKNNCSVVPEYLADTTSLNTDYYYRHSGNKIASPLVSHFLSDGKVTESGMNTIAKVILNAYKDNWDKVYHALTIEYSPIENVDETLTETTDSSGNTKTSGSNTLNGSESTTHTGSDTTSNTGTDTHAESGTDTVHDQGQVNDANEIKDGTTDTKNNIFGYNSSDASADTEQHVTVNQKVTDLTDTDMTHTTDFGHTDTETLDTTSTTNYNSDVDVTTNNTNTSSGSADTTGSEKHDLHRHGNVGVTTNQYMINEELQLRKNNFINYLFETVDNYLTLAVY